jgi:hypothetical protein
VYVFKNIYLFKLELDHVCMCRDLDIYSSLYFRASIYLFFLSHMASGGGNAPVDSGDASVQGGGSTHSSRRSVNSREEREELFTSTIAHLR